MSIFPLRTSSLSGQHAERPRKTKIGTVVAHVTRTSHSRSKRKRSRSLSPFPHRRVATSRECSGGRGNMLTVENSWYVAVFSASQQPSAPRRKTEGLSLSARPPGYSMRSLNAVELLIAYFVSCNYYAPPPPRRNVQL